MSRERPREEKDLKWNVYDRNSIKVLGQGSFGCVLKIDILPAYRNADGVYKNVESIAIKFSLAWPIYTKNVLEGITNKKISDLKTSAFESPFILTCYDVYSVSDEESFSFLQKICPDIVSGVLQFDYPGRTGTFFDLFQEAEGIIEIIEMQMGGPSIEKALKNDTFMPKKRSERKLALASYCFSFLWSLYCYQREMDFAHRDIKPDNSLLVKTPKEEEYIRLGDVTYAIPIIDHKIPILVDFGIVLRKSTLQVIKSNEFQGSSGEWIAGTPSFNEYAFEMFFSGKSTNETNLPFRSPASDIWSLGQMFAGFALQGWKIPFNQKEFDFDNIATFFMGDKRYDTNSFEPSLELAHSIYYDAIATITEKNYRFGAKGYAGDKEYLEFQGTQIVRVTRLLGFYSFGYYLGLKFPELNELGFLGKEIARRHNDILALGIELNQGGENIFKLAVEHIRKEYGSYFIQLLQDMLRWKTSERRLASFNAIPARSSVWNVYDGGAYIQEVLLKNTLFDQFQMIATKPSSNQIVYGFAKELDPYPPKESEIAARLGRTIDSAQRVVMKKTNNERVFLYDQNEERRLCTKTHSKDDLVNALQFKCPICE